MNNDQTLQQSLINYNMDINYQQPKQQILTLNDNQQEKWQVYQPKQQNISIFKVFNKEIKNILYLVIFICLIYLIFTLLSPLTILVITLFIGGSAKLLKIKLTQVRKQGLINKLSPKLKAILLEKSIFDIYSDLLYFPLVTKIIGAFIKPLLSKPHPKQLHHTFSHLPKNVQKAIAKKGILSLAPTNIQQLVINPEKIQKIPHKYGSPIWQWRNYRKYENHHQKVHEQTIIKKSLQRIDKKITWPALMSMSIIVGIGVYKMNSRQLRKMIIQNGSFVGILLISLITIIKIKKRIGLIKKGRQQKQRIQNLALPLLDKDQ